MKEHLFDKRVVTRALQEGLLKQEEYQRMLDALPDLSDRLQTTSGAGIAHDLHSSHDDLGDDDLDDVDDNDEDDIDNDNESDNEEDEPEDADAPTPNAFSTDV